MNIIIKRRKRKISLPINIDRRVVKIGVPYEEKMKDIINLINVGDSVLPAQKFGRWCKRNANRYSYPDKTKPKELRTIFTLSYYPYGNIDAGEREFDVERMCYPRVDVAPLGIEMVLIESEAGQKYVVADLDNYDDYHLLTAINIFVEVFGFCHLSDEGFEEKKGIARLHCNWEFLPPGEWPSKHLDNYITNSKDNDKKHLYFKERLEHIEKIGCSVAYTGNGGFSDYVAYQFKKICVLESAEYANATYIVPIDIWEELSKMTKYQLYSNNYCLRRLPHTTKWREQIVEIVHELEK